jgi:hypothetical protein
MLVVVAPAHLWARNAAPLQLHLSQFKTYLNTAKT